MTKLSQLLIGLTPAALKRLARKADISLDRLSEVSGGAEPTMAEARQLSVALGLSLEDLISIRSAPEQQAEMLFRRSIAHDRAVPASTAILARKIASSVQLVRDRQNHGPAWRGHFLAPENTLKNAEQNAAIFRAMFYGGDQFSPLTSLPRLASEDMGVLLFTIRNSEIDGASAYLDGVPFAFVSERFKGRMLFTLAHEIGHLVAHHTSPEAFAIIDEDIEALERAANRDLEIYADAFASALLMPRQAVGVALKAIRKSAKIDSDEIGDIEINYLARIFGISFWASARRCEDLDLIPRGGAYALNKAIVEHHGSAEKRAEEIGLPPRAEVHFPAVPWPLMEAAVTGVKAGEISIGKAASVLGLSVDSLFAANAPTRH